MDGDDNKIFHFKCDGYDNTLIIGESSNGRYSEDLRHKNGVINVVHMMIILFYFNDQKIIMLYQEKEQFIVLVVVALLL